MSKLLVIGLDGATLDLIEPWAKEGKLPMMNRLMNKGSYGRLQSVMPVMSSAAWPSFFTGVNPAKHGIYDFVQRDLSNYRLRLLGRQNIRSASIWNLMSQQGKLVGVMNVPMTYPPEEVNGFIITGLGTPDNKTFTFPQELSNELLKRGYKVNKRSAFAPGNESNYYMEIREIAERQFEATQWLMQTRKWDFFMTVFFDIDQMSHFFWRYMDPGHPKYNGSQGIYTNAILDFYMQIDSYIGRLVDQIDSDTNIIIMSDHGAGPLYQDVYLNEWLRQQGYLVLDPNGAHYTGIRRTFARIGLTRRHISSLLRRYKLAWFENWLTDHLGDYVFLLPRTQHTEFPVGIHWASTRAYSFGYQGQIYINLKGRESNGIVNPGNDYELLLNQIKAELLLLVDPKDGKPVVDEVYRKEQLFFGPYLDLAPDLTLIMRDMSYMTRYGYEQSPEAGQIFTDPPTLESGSHRRMGILIASGPDVKRGGHRSNSAQIIDLAPTILHLLGCSIPSTMDGQLLSDYFDFNEQPSIITGSPPTPDTDPTTETLSESEYKEMMNRLKKMGYLE